MNGEHRAHILIVSDQHDVTRALRTALEHSGQGYVVGSVFSGEEALLELGQVTYDLVITDTHLPGMPGMVLLERMHKRWPATAAVVITSSPAGQVNDELKRAGLDVLHVFQKPLDPDAFLAALHGTSTVMQENLPLVLTAQPDMPIEPARELLARQLAAMRVDLNAQEIALIHHDGRVVMRDGSGDELPRFRELAVLLANSLAAAAEISAHLGSEPAASVHHYAGSSHEVYVLSAGFDFLIAIIFPAGSQKQMGPVLRYGRPAAEEIAALLGAAPLPHGALRTFHAEAPSAGIHQQELSGEAEPPDTDRVAEGKDEAESAFEIDFDSLAHEPRVDTGELERFWSEAVEDDLRISDDALSLDEAVEQGLLPDDTDL